MEKEIKLYATDFVILNKATNKLITFTDGDVVIYGAKEDALFDCVGYQQEVISCTELSKETQELLLTQIKNNL